jgi:S1-C subfamily serine protease
MPVATGAADDRSARFAGKESNEDHACHRPGSGSVIEKRGDIVTNDHVVQGA